MAMRTKVALAGIAVLLLASTIDRPLAARASAVEAIRVRGADASQERMVGWAVGRFRSAGLGELPPLEVVFPANGGGCRGGLGYYRGGRLDLCTGVSTNLFARKVILHELSHAWTEANVAPEVRERFLELRGIREWNSLHVPWRERGSEQAAEILAWGLGEGVFSPLIPEPTDEASLARAFSLLTGGGEPPVLAPAAVGTR